MEPCAKAAEHAGIGFGIGASLGWAVHAIGTKLGWVQGFSAADLAVLRYAVPRLGAGRAAIFPAAVPPVAVPLTGEIPGALTLLGVGVATLGLAGSLDLLRMKLPGERP